MPRDIVFINQWPLEHTKVPPLEPKYYAVGSQDPEVIHIALMKVIKSHLLRLINDLKKGYPRNGILVLNSNVFGKLK